MWENFDSSGREFWLEVDAVVDSLGLEIEGEVDVA
jgi:hypothetical protein